MGDNPSDKSAHSNTEQSHPSTDEVTSDNAGESALELDDVFEALGHSLRRYLVSTLVNGSNEATLSELSTKIASWELDKSENEVTDAERKSIYISLYHSHIPKLADLGVLDYEEQENIIVQAKNIEQVQAVLKSSKDELTSRQEIHTQNQDDDTR